MTETYDVVVVGGGAAGLSAALVLGRARRRTIVVDAGEPRNAPAAHMQGFLSRDGMAPAEFLAIGREEIARYGVELVRDRAVDAARGTGGSRCGWRGDGPCAVGTWLLPRGSGMSCPTFPASPSGGGGTCCTAPTATAGRCGIRRSGWWARVR